MRGEVHITHGTKHVAGGVKVETPTSRFTFPILRPTMLFELRWTTEGRHVSRSFSLIEIMVTLAIIGMLTVTILPTLGKYNRTNNVVLSAQSLREALGEARSYAGSPDPSICPTIGALTHPVNQYAVFLSSPGANTTLPALDPTKASPQNYECGIVVDNSTTIASNQFAILARSLVTDASGAVTAEFNEGVVRIGSLDSPAVASVPIQGAAAHAMMAGYKSPSGAFFSSLDANLSYVPALNQVVLIPSGTKTTAAASAGQYTLLGIAEQIGNPPTYPITIFINNATGQITSNGSTPSGFN